MSKFTPGPWEVREPNGPGNGIQISSMDREWPRLPEAWLGSMATSEEQIANARLISAAPGIYEALKGMVEFVKMIDRNCPPEDDTWLRARQYENALEALAKADGK